jgi:chemotaxis protein CheD
MKLPGPPLPQRHLQPGELLITTKPQWVITLLGSCVAVTMFNARFNIAAICHSMLPDISPRDADTDQPFRYLSRAIPTMAERFLRHGLKPEEVEVKMFGGANVIDMGGLAHDDRWIGTSNVTSARQLLEAGRFRIKAQNVGGDCGCKIVFNTRNGEVLHKKLTRNGRKFE